jgi:transcriptional regulator with XRE-family HTH domain
MSERMIRAANLRLIRDKEGLSNEQLGKLLGWSGAYAGRLINRKTTFYEDKARFIEEKFNKPYRWLDEIHSEGEYDQADPEYKALRPPPAPDESQQPTGTAASYQAVDHVILMTDTPPLKWEHVSAQTPRKTRLIPATNTAKVPVVAWTLLDVAVNTPNREWPDEAQVLIAPITTSVSELTKAVEVLESPLPTISAGDIIAVDPVAQPWHDCVVVLAIAGSNTPILRRYRSISGGGFEAICPSEPPLDSVRHALRILGVVVSLQKKSF